jgi:hypothetical protein
MPDRNGKKEVSGPAGNRGPGIRPAADDRTDVTALADFRAHAGRRANAPIDKSAAGPDNHASRVALPGSTVERKGMKNP